MSTMTCKATDPGAESESIADLTRWAVAQKGMKARFLTCVHEQQNVMYVYLQNTIL